MKNNHIIPLFTQGGTPYAVLLSAEVWEKTKKAITPILEAAAAEIDGTTAAPEQEKPEPLHEWEELKTYWDFKYPYQADVSCKNCGAHTDDWQNDPDKPFRFKSANFGGLAVFTCKSCGSLVRKKHFKDHVCFECVPSNGQNK